MYTHTCIHICQYIYIYMYIHTHICQYIDVCTYICISYKLYMYISTWFYSCRTLDNVNTCIHCGLRGPHQHGRRAGRVSALESRLGRCGRGHQPISGRTRLPNIPSANLLTRLISLWKKMMHSWNSVYYMISAVHYHHNKYHSVWIPSGVIKHGWQWKIFELNGGF